MKCLIVNLNSSQEYSHDDKNIIELDMIDYLEFIQIAKQASVLDDILKNVKFGCSKCKSFVVATSTLYNAIEKVLEFIDSDFVSDSDVWKNVYDNFWELKNRLVNACILTDEEWTIYFTIGLKNYNFIHDQEGELLTDDEGNPMRFTSDEVVFQFDDKCECSTIIDKFYDEK